MEDLKKKETESTLDNASNNAKKDKNKVLMTVLLSILAVSMLILIAFYIVLIVKKNSLDLNSVLTAVISSSVCLIFVLVVLIKIAQNNEIKKNRAVVPDETNEEWKEDDLLKVRNLRTTFFTENGAVRAVNGISFNLSKGKVLGIVGESGSGKSVTAYSIMQILTPPGEIVGGSIKFNNEELVGASEKTMQKIRGNKISIIFQDPMTSLNPVFSIGNQLSEAILLHTDRTRKQAKQRSIELLELVGINEPKKRLKQYPHELSGGMRQRIGIAMALACEPDILIADEPTTALDVTIQAQILELMQKLQKELGMAIIMITHDLGVIAQMCDEVIVMYAGKICEQGTAEEIFYNPKHEYTKGLLASIPYGNKVSGKLSSIEGTPVDLLALPKGCAFAPRCNNCLKICLEQQPERLVINDDHMATCWMNVLEGLKDGSVVLMEDKK